MMYKKSKISKRNMPRSKGAILKKLLPINKRQQLKRKSGLMDRFLFNQTLSQSKSSIL